MIVVRYASIYSFHCLRCNFADGWYEQEDALNRASFHNDARMFRKGICSAARSEMSWVKKVMRKITYARADQLRV